MNLKTYCMNRDIEYREIEVQNKIFNKFYEIYNPKKQTIVGIPDGSVDIQFVRNEEKVKALVCGTFLEGSISRTGNYTSCFGVKFNPGVIPDCFMGNMEGIINNRCKLNEFAHLAGLEEIFKRKEDFEDRVDYFLEQFQKIHMAQPHMIITGVIEEVKEKSGYINVSELVKSLGYSHRYADRVFKGGVGVSIKKYANIIRLQESIEALRDQREDEVYERLGYYDQAHFIHDFKRFTGLTPNRLRKQGKEITIV